MALPGFTAESSVGPMTQTYRVVSAYGGPGLDHVGPAQDVGDDMETDMLEGNEEMDMETEEMDETSAEVEE